MKKLFYKEKINDRTVLHILGVKIKLPQNIWISKDKPNRTKISVVINTYNAQRLLEKAIQSVIKADEIIICDMFSKDKTIEIAKKYDCKIYYHKKLPQPDPARNFAISKATGDWILILDADEIVSGDLWEFLVDYANNPLPNKFVVNLFRKNWFFDGFLDHVGLDCHPRFFKNGYLQYGEGHVHIPPKPVNSEVFYIPQEKDKDLTLYHYSYANFEEYLTRQNIYTNEELNKIDLESIKRSKRQIFSIFYSSIKTYFKNKSYKDGLRGFIWCLYSMLYKMTVYVKAIEKKEELEKIQATQANNVKTITMPLVSIVTVTYNLIKNDRKESFIKALESVQNQTYKNIEHIVIDGSSDDGTVDLIKKYADKGWIKYSSEPDTGLYDAMNKGAMLAKGKYLMFLNSDDFYSGVEGVEKSVLALENTDADYSYAKSKILDSKNNIADYHIHDEPDFSKIFTDMPFSHQTMMIKTELFKKMGMFDLKYKSASDYDFVLKLIFKRYKQIFIPYEFVTYKLGGYSCKYNDLATDEVADIYHKNYNYFCKISFDECKNIYKTKDIPLKLVFKLLPYLDRENLMKFAFNWEYYKKKSKETREKILRIRTSKKNPMLTILGIEIIKSKED